MAMMKENTVQFSTGMPSSMDCPTNQFTQCPSIEKLIRGYLDFLWQSKTWAISIKRGL
jgi:hypothetical protein